MVSPRSEHHGEYPPRDSDFRPQRASSYQTVACGRTGRRGAPPALQRRMALLQRRSRRRRAGRTSTIPSGATSDCRTIGPSKGPSIPSSTRTPARCPSSGPAGTASRSRFPPTPRAATSASSSMAPCPTRSVWLNGQELGGRPYGYIGFAFDLTPHLHFGGAGQRAGGAADARRSLLALVSRRRHLSQRVARCHRAGARGALGNLRHHARGHRRRRPPSR